jgi:dihydroneopterin aldolase
MNNENQNSPIEKAADEVTDSQQESPPAEGEFKVTVRKLEMPVRPRGVLAE